MKYEDMKKRLVEATDSYYNKSHSIISDKEYDELRDEFAKRYPNDPFLKTIGAPLPEVSEWEKAKHKIPMYSCNKVNTVDEFEAWANDNGLANEEMVTSEKLDGASLEIEYVDGKMVKAITRGDGTTGEVITQNVLRMQNVKNVLPVSYTGSLRGEVMMKVQNLANVNQLCEVRGAKPYQNVRNGASGIARGYDGKYVEYLYVLYYYASGDFKTKKEVYDFLEKKLKLETCKHFFGNIETTKRVYNEYEQSVRAELDHEIDGLVIEPNNIAKLNALGLKAENLRGQIAWKFKSMKKPTKVVGVEWQLGNSGRVTPVLVMEPVSLAGVTVTKASVHNLAMFNEFKFHKGDTVLVERCNDVIPGIIENLGRRLRYESGEKLEVPSHCPACGGKLSVGDKFLTCQNESCSGGEIGNLNKWVKKLDLKGIADATIEKLYEAGLVKTPADFYRLKPSQICGLEGFGSSSANKIVDTLNSKMEMSFGEFIGGLNIPNFSDKTAELLEKNGLETVDKILSQGIDDLASIKGIGRITAEAIIDGLKKKLKVIEDLGKVGVKIMKKEKKVVKSGSPFAGKRVVFTGALNIKRADAQRMVIEAGGECPSSLAKDTDYLVMADLDSTSTKAEKARKYGTKVLTENQFMQMIK